MSIRKIHKLLPIVLYLFLKYTQYLQNVTLNHKVKGFPLHKTYKNYKFYFISCFYLLHFAEATLVCIAVHKR